MLKWYMLMSEVLKLSYLQEKYITLHMHTYTNVCPARFSHHMGGTLVSLASEIQRSWEVGEGEGNRHEGTFGLFLWKALLVGWNKGKVHSIYFMLP